MPASDTHANEPTSYTHSYIKGHVNGEIYVSMYVRTFNELRDRLSGLGSSFSKSSYEHFFSL